MSEAESATEAVEETGAEDQAVETPVEPDVPVATALPDAAPGLRTARVLLCDRGHRTYAMWSEPATCKTRLSRTGPECGRPLYRIGELPEQVIKALNPLKASKKASKKK